MTFQFREDFPPLLPIWLPCRARLGADSDARGGRFVELNFPDEFEEAFNGIG